jgi:hypothetical protein
LQYDDQVNADASGNLWGKCLSSMKKCIFIHWRSVFVQFFANFSRLSLTGRAPKQLLIEMGTTTANALDAVVNF